MPSSLHPFTHVPRASRVLIALFALACVWYIALAQLAEPELLPQQLFMLLGAIIPCVGGVLGLRSTMAHARVNLFQQSLYLLSAGLLSWGVGSLLFASVHVLPWDGMRPDILAYAARLASWPLWVAGLLQLARATGGEKPHAHPRVQAVLLTVPGLLCAVAIYLILLAARGDLLPGGVISLDLGYIFGDALILAIALVTYVLSFEHAHGRYRSKILILLSGFVVQAIADILFVTTTADELARMGSLPDLITMAGMTLIGVGVSLLIADTHSRA